MIESAEAPQSYEEFVESNILYLASYDGSYCSPKSSSAFESWEESFSSLNDCCEAVFRWDMDACLNNELPEELVELIALAYEEPRRVSTPDISNVRYFASYGDESCLPRESASFERWEESFSSLEECCEMAFSWDIACLER